MLFGILAVSDPAHPELGQISGGLPFLVKDVLGPRLGVFLLLEVIFAVFVCALAVHAGSVRLMFAMARDNNLPFAHSLAHVQAWSKAPIVPSVVVGVLAAAILVVNINLPNVIETLCSVAIVWANLAYLLVTMPLLVARLRRGGHHTFGGDERRFKPHVAAADDHDRPASPYFSLGRWGLPVNAIAVVWGLFVVINIGWPRPEIYGAERLGPLRGASRHARLDRRRCALLSAFSAQADRHPVRTRGGGYPGVSSRSQPMIRRSKADGSVNSHPVNRELDLDENQRIGNPADRETIGGHGHAPGPQAAEEAATARRPARRRRSRSSWAGACTAIPRWGWWRRA